MTDYGLPRDVKECLENLEFIGMVNAGEKPDLVRKKVYNTESWWDQTCRFCRSVVYRDADRTTVCAYLDKDIKDAFRTIHNFPQDKYISKIIPALINAKYAIIKMKDQTYSCDTETKSKLKVLLTEIEDQLIKHPLYYSPKRSDLTPNKISLSIPSPSTPIQINDPTAAAMAGMSVSPPGISQSLISEEQDLYSCDEVDL